MTGDRAAPGGVAGARRAAGVLVAAAGTVALLLLTLAIGQQDAERVGRFFAYQAAALAVAAAVCAGVCLLVGRPRYLRWGRLGAPASAVRVLGIRDGESWRTTGLVFAAVITAATAAYLAAAHGSELREPVPAHGW